MWFKLLFGPFWLYWCYCLIVHSAAVITEEGTAKTSKYSIEELLNTVFPKNVTNDLDLDPCKADYFLGDIAIPFGNHSKPTKEEIALQEEVERYKKEVLEGLQIEEEGLTDLVRKKTKQVSDTVTARSYNDPIDGASAYTLDSNNGHTLKNSFNNLKTDAFDHGIQKRSHLMHSVSVQSNIGEDFLEVVRRRHEKGQEVNHPKQNSRQRRSYSSTESSAVDETSMHESEITLKYKKKQQNASQLSFEIAPSLGHHQPHRRVTRAATARKERVWDYGIIPYEIDGNFSGAHKALFKQAMRHWENFTCVQFIERNPDDHPNYILFTERPCGCCSFVGKRGNGAQAISIGKNCDKFGIVVHELGHVVGFWHEHTRPDRDKHVNIIRDNIMNGQEYNFNKLNEEEVNSLGLTYDYDSIMHYARNTFSKGTYLDTIQPIDVPGRTRPEIGQRLRLSEGDIAQTNLLYKCPKCGRTFQANAATFTSPSHINKNGTESTEKCEWRITSTHGEKIILNITELDIMKSPDCKTDFIEIRDGYWHKSELLGRFCGTGKIGPIISTGSRMLVTYVSRNPSGHRGFTASYEAVCGGEIFLDGGEHLESPNFPEDYEANKECIWKITVQENYQVALKFQSFEIENHDNCVYDYLEIRDGLSTDSPLLGVYCGYKIPPDIISTSNQLLVKFVSDGSVQKAGFSAALVKEYDECKLTNHGCAQQCINTLGSYECSCKIGYELHSDGKHCEDACGGVYDVSNGTITSPSFPDFYPPNKNCVWEIIAQPQYKITLNFTHFDLEGNSVVNMHPQQCDYDRIEVFSKMPAGKVHKHGIYCGGKAPVAINSESNVLRVIFSSDTSVQKTGFAAIFFTDMDECSVNNGGCQHDCFNTIGSFTCTCHNGFTLHENMRDCKEGGCKYEITNPYGEITSPNYPDYYPSRKDCVWHFVTTPGHRIKLMFLVFELEPHQECSYDHVAFYDGDSPESHSLGRFCGLKMPHPIVATGNQLYMVFKSDASVQRKGFSATHFTVCGGRLQASVEKKHFYSHSKFGSISYDNHTDCEWTIEAPPGYNVRTTFLTFDLEFEQNCSYDYLEVFNGLDSSGQIYGKFCGSNNPGDIISTQEALLLRFKTDDTIVAKGFSIAYEAVEPFGSEEEI